ncbi:hypothetical protein IFHNHDMJ_00599 [Synechococcus sp. CBW1107]|nr:hypothetical protein IFHNHDMJ_00599 [Synechococcus sp. CBW1107]
MPRETSEPGAPPAGCHILQERYRASERLACRVLGQPRSTQRHGGKVIDLEEAKLRHRLRVIASEHIRWGRRMAYRLLRREGWTVNYKRVQRLWREEGLQRPTPRKRKRARPADGSVRRHRAEHPHQVWAMDFQFDATADGRRLKSLNVIDEHSRLCLAIRVGRRCKAKDVMAVLEELTASTRHPRSSDRTTGRSSLPRPCGTGARPAPPPARPTSRRDPHGRTASPNRSMAASGMSSSIPSFSPQLQRRRSWPIAGAGSTTHSGHIQPSRGVRPWRQLNRELQHDHDHPLS